MEHFIVGYHRHSVGGILSVNPVLDPGDARIVLGDLNLEAGLDPVLDPGRTGLVRDRHANRTFEQLLCIETVVDFLVFQEAVRMDARPGYVKIPAYKRVIPRNLKAQLFFGVFG